MYPRVNINLYKIVVMAYKLRSLTKAAKKLMISQSAVSQNVKNLESQLNCKLFKMTTKEIKPTHIANAIFEKIDTALNTIGECESMVNNNDYEGNINIGVQSFIFNAYLVNIIVGFIKKYPKININIIDKSSSNMLDMLKKEDIDFIFDIDNPTNVNSKYKIDILSNINSVLVVKNTDSRNFLSKQDILGSHFVISTTNSQSFLTLCNNINDFKLAKITCAFTTENILSLVRAGVGIGLVPNVCAKKNNGIKIINTDFDMPSTKLWVCYERDGLSRVGKKLLDFIKTYYI